MSSSSISSIYIRGLDGNIGPTGFTGNTGSTGSTGNTGSTGSLGAYYTNYSLSGNTLTIFLSNGNTFEVYGTFKGATTNDTSAGAATGSNTGGQVALLASVLGGTFNFKGISAYGSLRASYTGANNEYISIDSIYFGTNIIGNFDPTTLSPRELTFLGTKTLVHGANLTYRTDQGFDGVCGSFDFAYTTNPGSSSDTSNHLNSASKILALGPIKFGAISGITTTNVPINGVGTTLGIILDANAAGTFVCKTPIGINGITGSFKKNEIASISLLIDSDNVWKFPSNVYFESDENYLSCGKNLIGLFSYDGGESWIASVSHRGHSIANANYQCVPGYLFGSCCYTNADGALSCKDYSTKTECNNLFGTFHPVQTCQESCSTAISVCCANGKCIEGVSITECEAYGGSYWSGYTCGFAGGTFNYPSGDLTAQQIREQGRFCYDPCTSNTSVCCKDGNCLGNYTRVQCELILGGKSLTAASCEDANCCEYNNANIQGACCKCIIDGVNITSECSFTTLSECRSSGGYFMGPGKQCSDVSCGCVCGNTNPEDTGACCKTINDITTCIAEGIVQSGCSGTDGAVYTWRRGLGCDSCNNASSTGICCKNATCTSATTKEECDADCGHWIPEIVVQDNICTNADNCGEQFTYKFGIRSRSDDCAICSLYRPVVYLAPCGSITDLGFPTYESDSISGANWSNQFFMGNPLRFDHDFSCYQGGPGKTYGYDFLFNKRPEGIGHAYVIKDVTEETLYNKIIETFGRGSSDPDALGPLSFSDSANSYFNYAYGNNINSGPYGNKKYDAYVDLYLFDPFLCPKNAINCCSCTEDGIVSCNPSGVIDYTSINTSSDSATLEVVCFSGNCIDCDDAGGVCNPSQTQGESCTYQPCPPNDPPPCLGTINPGNGIEEGDCSPIFGFYGFPFWCSTPANNSSNFNPFWDNWEPDPNVNYPGYPNCEDQLCTSGNFLKNIKITINNQDICIPTLCSDGCLDFELCEET